MSVVTRLAAASLLFKGLDGERESSFLTVRAESSSLTSVRGRRLAPISHAGQGKGSPRDHHNLGSCALHRWPAPAPSCPSATISTSTAAALHPRQPVTRYDQPGPAAVPRRERIVRSDRSSSTRLSASSGDFSQRASGAPPSEQRVRKRQSTQFPCMRHDAPPARPRCGHGERGHR